MNDKLKQLAELMEEKAKWEHEKASLMADNANLISKIEELKKQLKQNQKE